MFIALLFVSCSEDPNKPDKEPDAPSNLELSQLDNQRVLINWEDNSNNEDSFSIDRKFSGLAWEIDHIIVGEDVVTCIDTNMTYFGRYDYRIKAVNGDKVSGYSVDNITFVDYDTLAAPSEFSALQINASKIQLSWQDNSTKEDGFRLDRKIGEGEWDVDYAVIPSNNETFIDSNLTVYDLYSYRLFAYIYIHESDPVETSLNFINSDSLAAPSGLELVQPDFYSIELNWNDNSTDEEGFRIDRKIGENNWEENYQVLDANETTFTDEDLDIIETYKYRVYAFLGDTLSAYTEAEIDFYYNDVAMIDIDVEYVQSYIGLEYVDITATLLGEDYNVVDREYPVWFRIAQGPEGMSINNLIFGTEDSLSIQSNNGHSSVNLFPGTESGLAAIEVFVYNSANTRISEVESDITIVVPQPPASIQIVIDGMDTGISLGNGDWKIEAAATVHDANGNPVSHGTAVWFEIEDTENPGTAPDWAYIEAASYTGNENAAGDSIPGVAYTTLTYEGIHTNDELLIRVEVSGITTLIDTATVALPLQFGNISVIATPSHVDWNEYTNDEDSLFSTIRVLLRDGQENDINGQQIFFTSTHGTPVPCEPGMDPYIGYTGEVNGQNGLLHKQYYFYKYECSPPDPPDPGITEVTIEAMILGTTISEQVTVTLYRYID
jgi:hypothetical protein